MKMTSKTYVIKELNPSIETTGDFGNCVICGKKAKGFIGKDDPHLKDFNLKKDSYTCEDCFDKHVNGELFFSDDGTTLVPLFKISKERQGEYYKLKDIKKTRFCSDFEIIESIGTKV